MLINEICHLFIHITSFFLFKTQVFPYSIIISNFPLYELKVKEMIYTIFSLLTAVPQVQRLSYPWQPLTSSLPTQTMWVVTKWPCLCLEELRANLDSSCLNSNYNLMIKSILLILLLLSHGLNILL